MKEFKANIKTNQELSILNQKGDVLKDDDIITTGMTIQVGENLTYTLVVRGDVDGDGNITINDLAQLKLYVIELVTFDEVSLKAANVDLDEENEISINDLSVLKLLLIGL